MAERAPAAVPASAIPARQVDLARLFSLQFVVPVLRMKHDFRLLAFRAAQVASQAPAPPKDHNGGNPCDRTCTTASTRLRQSWRPAFRRLEASWRVPRSRSARRPAGRVHQPRSQLRRGPGARVGRDVADTWRALPRRSSSNWRACTPRRLAATCRSPSR